MPASNLPPSFGRPEPEPEQQLAMMPGVALVTVLPVIDEEALAALKDKVKTAVYEAFSDGLRQAMTDLEATAT